MSKRRIKVPPLSQAEVNMRTTKKLDEKGVDKHLQAVFYHELAAAVIQSENPLLAALIPHVRRHKETAWIAAYQIINDFLLEHGMKLTAETIQLEHSSLHDRMNLAMLLHMQGKKDQIIQLLTMTSKHRRLPTKDKIAELVIPDY